MSKITRDAFGYLEPKGNSKDFAQCATCHHWRPGNKCSILGDRVNAYADSSCIMYLPTPADNDPPKKIFTPEEVGLVHRQVRCENCRFFAPVGRCGLFSALNQAHRNIFNLDETVKAKACCNAQTPAEDRAPVHRVLKSKRLENV